MTIDLDHRYRIVTDLSNSKLQRRILSKKSERWVTVSYHATLESVLKHVLELKLKEEANCTLAELLQHLQGLTRTFEAIGEKCASVWNNELQEGEKSHVRSTRS